MPTPNRQPHARIDWDAYDDLIESPQVAALLGVKPESLRMYVKRGQIAEPAQRTDNRAWYRKQDVQEAVIKRQGKRAGVTVGNGVRPENAPNTGTELEATPPPFQMEQDDEQARSLIRMTQNVFGQLQQQGQMNVAIVEELQKVLDNDRKKDETIRNLIEQNASLQRQLEAKAEAEQARKEAEQKEVGPNTQAEQKPRTWWQRLFG